MATQPVRPGPVADAQATSKVRESPARGFGPEQRRNGGDLERAHSPETELVYV